MATIIFTILLISFNTKSRSGCEQTIRGGFLRFSELRVAMPFFIADTDGTPWGLTPMHLLLSTPELPKQKTLFFYNMAL